MLNQIFNPENLFFRGCAKLADVVGLSVLWIFCCLPVITIGPATAALYYCVVKCLRRGEGDTYKNFFRCFRDNFRVGALSTLACLPVVLFMSWAYVGLLDMARAGDRVAMVLFVAFWVLCLVVMGIMLYLFPVLSRFTFGVGALIAAAGKLALRHLPSTVVVVLLNLQIALACVRYWFPVVFLPALGALLSSLFLERIFKKYTPAAPGAEEDGAEKPWYLK